MLKKGIAFFLFSIFLTSCFSINTPVKTSPAQSVPLEKFRTTSTKTYLIKKGDSLWRVARNHNTTVDNIMILNKGIDADDLKIGQKISVPKKRHLSKRKFNWPIEGEIINTFGEKVDYTINKGVNILGNSSNPRVQASKNGKIIYANNLKGWGKTIIIQHESSYYTIYANLDEIFTREGETVDSGESIGNIASGKNGKYVLHFEIRKRSIPENPLKYLN